MDQQLYDRAEQAYQSYKVENSIVPELLFAWLLAEVHFATSETHVQNTVLGDMPKNAAETALLVETAHAYRGFRQEIMRANKVKPKGDMHAVRPEKS